MIWLKIVQVLESATHHFFYLPVPVLLLCITMLIKQGHTPVLLFLEFNRKQ